VEAIMSSLLDLETPAVVIQRQILDDNIGAMQYLAREHGLRLRPHIKTHKCLAVARRQMAAGACGITAAKVDEALVFIHGGIQSVTLAQPQIIASKVDRLMAAAKSHACEVRWIVDSRPGLELLARRAEAYGRAADVFIKIDVGLHRCGRRPDDPVIQTLAGTIQAHPRLHLVGLLSHAGHAYGAANHRQAAAIAEDERRTMLAVARRLEAAGIPVPEISVGSTPTVLAAERFDGITEIRPGNYVFMDRTPLRLGLITREQIALTVLATVISRNTDYLIVDAGSKTFSSDGGAHGSSGSAGFAVGWPMERFGEEGHERTLVRLSEEHGFIPRSGPDLPLGTCLRFIPNHACPVANLTSAFLVADDDALYEWTVDARGRTR
jgi:D-serine deaminase-like pyridoxal phosphate-dependent protein